MIYRVDGLSSKAGYRTFRVRLASFLILAAAGVWLTACSGGEARVRVTAPSATPASSGTAASAQTAGRSSPAGDQAGNASSPAAAASNTVKPVVLTAKDQGQGGVTIKATWVVAGSPEAKSAGLDRYLAFSVVMDTHSVDLSQYDLLKLSVLRDEKGNEIPPAAWESLSEDSHHRSGVMKFPKGAEEDARSLDLVIRDVGGARERVLRWELGG